MIVIRSMVVLAAATLLPRLTNEARTPFADFEESIGRYMLIHRDAENEAGRPSPTRSAETLDRKRKALADAIRSRREAALPGDIFTPAVAGEFRRVIGLNLKHHPRRIAASIRSGELVHVKIVVNGEYPNTIPLETMPATLLMAFPKLPGQLEYRIAGTTLLLRDVTANLIVDLIPDAVPTSTGALQTHGG